MRMPLDWNRGETCSIPATEGRNFSTREYREVQASQTAILAREGSVYNHFLILFDTDVEKLYVCRACHNLSFFSVAEKRKLATFLKMDAVACHTFSFYWYRLEQTEVEGAISKSLRHHVILFSSERSLQGSINYL